MTDFRRKLSLYTENFAQAHYRPVRSGDKHFSIVIGHLRKSSAIAANMKIDFTFKKLIQLMILLNGINSKITILRYANLYTKIHFFLINLFLIFIT